MLLQNSSHKFLFKVLDSMFSISTAYAADPEGFGRVVEPIITNIIYPVVGLLFAVGVVVFAYGVFEMIWKGNDPKAREQGRNHMLGGVIGMFIMVSAWGFIYLVSNTVKGL